MDSDVEADRINELGERGERSLTHGGVVGVGKALVHPLPHEHPGVVGEGALDNLVVVLFQLFGGLCGEKQNMYFFLERSREPFSLAGSAAWN